MEAIPLNRNPKLNLKDLKQWRKSHKLSQAVFAKIAEVSLMTIAKFESGKGTPQKKTLQKIIRAVKTVEREIKSVNKSVAVTEPKKRPPELSDLKQWLRQRGLRRTRGT